MNGIFPIVLETTTTKRASESLGGGALRMNRALLTAPTVEGPGLGGIRITPDNRNLGPCWKKGNFRSLAIDVGR
jgi:hypothetical protein